jgi:hypothetical protein
MGNGVYTWLPVSTAVQQLAQRLNDPNMVFWSYNELFTYITRALQMQNSLCWVWRTDFTYSDPVNIWNSLGSLAGSPRLRTMTDVEVYAELEFMLLEPSNLTGTWTGTNQFSLSVLSQALQRRRDEMIQRGNLNQSLMTGIPLTPNTIRTELDDSVIGVERVRYIPATGSPNTLYRDDTVAQEFYEAPLYQLNPGTPQTFSLSSEPPLSWQVDVPPAQPGTYEAIVLQSGAPFNPPTPTLVGIPDDFVFVLEFGALADLLGQESESTDLERAAYCMKKYQEGLELMLKTPWIGLGKINGAAVSIDSIYAMDQYSVDWDNNPSGFGPVIVAGGVDNIAAPVAQGVGCKVLGNAPILDSTNTYVQISRPMADTMFDLAQARAMFKVAGAEWKAALELEKRALLACEAERVRLKSQGAFSDFFDERGRQQERDRNRYNAANKGK